MAALNQPNSVFRMRPSGNNANGAGYDATIAGAGTDYSQQNTAQASGTNGAASGTTNFSDATAAAFTSAMVGNAINISVGGGMTTGSYFVTAYVNPSNVTLDRSPGTGSGATWKLGGAWADWTNLTSTNYGCPGMTLYVLGSGIPNPSAYSYDYTFTAPSPLISGSATVGRIAILADPATPNYSTGGRPVISTSSIILYSGTFYTVERIAFVASGNSGTNGMFYNTYNINFVECAFDQNGYDVAFSVSAGIAGLALHRCECFSSVPKRGTNAQYAWSLSSSYTGQAVVMQCNFHDLVGPVLQTKGMGAFIEENVITNNGGTAITANNYVYGYAIIVKNQINASGVNGIEFTNQASLASAVVVGNFITNTVGVGIKVDVGTATVNDLIRGVIRNNWFYNNTTDTSGLSTSATTVDGRITGDSIGTDPQYVNTSTEDLTPGANALNWYQWSFQNSIAGKVSPISYLDPGAIQPQGAGGGGGGVVFLSGFRA
jgi:hypothetical protein